jgi:predicted molibdopterin-dependent oxidoreductase YjgC
VEIQKQFTSIASLIKVMSQKSTSVINSARCTNKVNFMLKKCNDVNHISEEVFNSLDSQNKMCVDPFCIGLLRRCITENKLYNTCSLFNILFNSLISYTYVPLVYLTVEAFLQIVVSGIFSH